jgi:hypothetical protein
MTITAHWNSAYRPRHEHVLIVVSRALGCLLPACLPVCLRGTVRERSNDRINRTAAGRTYDVDQSLMAQLRKNYRSRLLETVTAKSCIDSMGTTFARTHHLIDDMIVEYKGDVAADHVVHLLCSLFFESVSSLRCLWSDGHDHPSTPMVAANRSFPE